MLKKILAVSCRYSRYVIIIIFLIIVWGDQIGDAYAIKGYIIIFYPYLLIHSIRMASKTAVIFNDKINIIYSLVCIVTGWRPGKKQS